MEEKAIGFETKKLCNRIGRHLAMMLSRAGLDQVTIQHGWMLGYIYEHENEGIVQKDFETHFQLAKSSVTAMLQLMEKKGYITRAAVAKDARLKEIHLTELGKQMHDKTIETIRRMDRSIEQGITTEERETFFRVLAKLNDNIDEAEIFEDTEVCEN